MSQPIGLFLAVYDIGENQPGAPLFAVRLTVHPPTKTVMGAGQITQTTNPPLDIGTRLEGRYTAMTVMPKSTHILLTATGYPFISAPPIGPVLFPNVQLHMVLAENWQSGTANYEYLDAQGRWRSVEHAPVKAVRPMLMGQER